MSENEKKSSTNQRHPPVDRRTNDSVQPNKSVKPNSVPIPPKKK